MSSRNQKDSSRYGSRRMHSRRRPARVRDARAEKAQACRLHGPAWGHPRSLPPGLAPAPQQGCPDALTPFHNALVLEDSGCCLYALPASGLPPRTGACVELLPRVWPDIHVFRTCINIHLWPWRAGLCPWARLVTTLVHVCPVSLLAGHDVAPLPLLRPGLGPTPPALDPGTGSFGS